MIDHIMWLYYIIILIALLHFKVYISSYMIMFVFADREDW